MSLYIAAFIFFCLLPKTSQQHDASTTMFHCGDAIGDERRRVSSNTMLGVQAKQFNLCFIRREHFLVVLEVFFVNLQAGCHVPFTEEWLPSVHSTKQALLMECCRNGWPSQRSSSLHRAILELCGHAERPLGSWSSLRPFYPDRSDWPDGQL